MAVTLEILQALKIDAKTTAGDVNDAQSITLTSGQSYVVQDKTVADDYGEDLLWASGDGGLDNFTYGFIYSDQAVWVQLKNDDTGEAEYIRLYVPANVLFALPAKCAGNTSDAFDGSALVDNTDYADTVQIEVSRDAADAAGDATVSLFLFA